MGEEDRRLTFKEMTDLFEVTPRTLRHYEYIELLAPERDGRTRYYTPREVARMKLILRGRRWGFSLEEIRQWLAIYDEAGTEVQMRRWVELADRKLAELHREREQLAEIIAELQKTRDEVAEGWAT